MTATPNGCNHWLVSKKKKRVCERHGPLKKVHLQSMLATRCRLNQRSCTWIIATSEPVPVSHLHILSYRSQSQSDAIQQIAVCDVISRRAGNIKNASPQIIFPRCVALCGLMLILSNGDRSEIPYYTAAAAAPAFEAGVQNWSALYFHFKVG